MAIVSIVNRIVKRLKGDGYTIDPRVSGGYLIALLARRFIMFVRGKVVLIKHRGFLFVGRGVVLRARYQIHVGRGVTFDEGSFIDALSSGGVVLGDNVSLGKRSVIECSGSLSHLGKGIKVGNNVGLGRDCYYGCAGGIEIADNTIIGNYVSFHSENHITTSLEVPIRQQGVSHKGISIGNDCWIGAKVTVLDGVVLGNGCIVAAGAVLTGGVYEPFCIYGGVPAKMIKRRLAVKDKFL
ncbi:acyltransferase [Pararcticibacter amylolyticus]|uniref:Transferase n=1 Tax=Pararcticibacter amylolyticus TaxID=2173175 RepID=A0A2U2PBE7_9SPHI|nr:acyltransferase [Pararcticibacter amylolyticus]PWG78721.1 hypothetical protein DDR33_21105 [Pararcticibacter amylolyticus]